MKCEESPCYFRGSCSGVNASGLHSAVHKTHLDFPVPVSGTSLPVYTGIKLACNVACHRYPPGLCVSSAACISSFIRGCYITCFSGGEFRGLGLP